MKGIGTPRWEIRVLFTRPEWRVLSPESSARSSECEPGLKPRQAKAADDPLGDRVPAFRCHSAASFNEFGLGRGIHHVAFAERFPVQTVRFKEFEPCRRPSAQQRQRGP